MRSSSDLRCGDRVREDVTRPRALPLARARLAVACTLILAVAVAVFTLAGQTPGNIDDAFIVLVYARHLVESGSIYWNLADGLVDGFTSPLDLAVKAVAILFFRRDPIAVAWWIAVAYDVFAVAMAVRACLEAPLDRREWLIGTVGAIAVAGGAGLAIGTAFVLETPLYVAMALVAIVAWPRDESRERLAGWGLALAALALVRPEGLAVSLALWGLFAATTRGEQRWVRIAVPAIVLFAIVGGYAAWHQATFGYFAPNTYYAKSSASHLNELGDGVRYVLAHGGSRIVLLQILALAAMPLVARRFFWEDQTARARFERFTVAAAVSLAVVVIGGGDSYKGARFLALPAALATVGTAIAAARAKTAVRWVATAVIAVIAVGEMVPLVTKAGAKIMFVRAVWPLDARPFECERQVVEKVATALPAAVVVQTDYQRMKYFADGLRVVDLSGLNDKALAHVPVEGKVRFGKYRSADGPRVRGDIWVFGNRAGMDPLPMAAVPLATMLRDPRQSMHFVGHQPTEAEIARTTEYVPASAAVCGHYFNFLVKRDVAPALERAGLWIGPP
jgi:hypothetical protein